MKTMLYIVLIIVGLVLLVFVGVGFYMWKFQGDFDVSKNQPFLDVVGKELTLERDAFLVEYEGGATFLLVDAKGDFGDRWHPLPKGSKIKFDTANYKRTVNESSGPVSLVGEIHVGALGKKVPFIYRWGFSRIDWSDPENGRAYRTYDLAPWQDVPLESEYPYDPRKTE